MSNSFNSTTQKLDKDLKLLSKLIVESKNNKSFLICLHLSNFKVPFYINKKNFTKSLKLSTKVVAFDMILLQELKKKKHKVTLLQFTNKSRINSKGYSCCGQVL